MDNTDKIAECFELILKKQNFNKRSALYNNNIQTNKQTHKPLDVLKSVSTQLKAIQTADRIKSGKCTGKEFKMYNKSSFLPLNKLPVYKEVQKQKLENTNKFETQCVSDTQLINIIHDVEAIVNTNKGITQEFESSFHHLHTEKDEHSIKHIDGSNQKDNFVDKPFKSNKEVFGKNNIENTCYRNKESEIHYIFNNNSEKTANNDGFELICPNKLLENEKSTQMFDENITQIYKSGIDTLILSNKGNKQIVKDNINESYFVNTNDNANEDSGDLKKILSNFIQIKASNLESSERSPSPVLNIIKTAIVKSPWPLVFNLDDFEKFEKIAIPIVEDTLNKEMARHLINSQVLGKELHLAKDAGVVLNVNVRKVSCIFEDKKNEFQIQKHLDNDIIKCTISDKERTDKCNVNIIEKNSNSLNNEIIFSSDEENTNVNKQLQNLPLTCVLNKSFYDKSDVLDKTIYVGFQTASNKSIQVYADTFVKAKSILDNVNEAYDEEKSLTELVQVCDSNNFQYEENVDKDSIIINKEAKNKLKKEVMEIENIADNIDLTKITEIAKQNLIKRKSKNISNWTWSSSKELYEKARSATPINKMDDVMTNNNKKIISSNKVLDTCKKVFQDVDIDERFDIKSVLAERNSKFHEVEPVLGCIYDTHTKAETHYNTVGTTNTLIFQTKIIDENIIQEFENIKMSLEEYKNKIKKQPVQFAGFKTASNKIIKLSDIALATSKNVFQDIDLTEILEKYKQEEMQTVDKYSAKDIKDTEVIEINSKTIPNLNFEYNQPANPKLSGFNTARNKKITISEQALARTKSVFQDIDYNELNIPKSKVSKTTDIQLDLTEMPEVTKLATQTNTENPEDVTKLGTRTNKTDNSFKQHLTKKSLFVGFKTANYQEISISEDALSKTKNIFKGIDKEESKLNKKDENTFQGFKTASNKHVSISKEAFVKGQKIFQDIEMTVNDTRQNIAPSYYQKQLSKVFSGFQAASNKPMNISTESFVKSENNFKEAAVSYPDINKVAYPNSLDNKETVPFHGFQTASNKPVMISAETLDKSKKIFQDLYYTPMDNLPIEYSKMINSLPNVDIPEFQGFQTASNKKVVISKETLAKTIKLLDDIDGIEKKTLSSFSGFQTAGNKPISISEQSLAKSRQTFQDINFKEENDEVTINMGKETVLNNNNVKDYGFNTVYLQDVQVSENTKKSRKLCSRLDKELYNKNKTKATIHHKDENINLDIINTQVLNNFEETLCTEDFYHESPRNKRSGSPVLSCPKAKKRKKFETPYINNQKDIENTTKAVNLILKNKNMEFDDNYKKITKFTLKDLLKFEKCNKNRTKPFIDMNFDNLLKFDFVGDRNDLTQGKLTMNELKQLFIHSVDQKLIPEDWLHNHLKLIIWKLLSYEIKFPNSLNIVCTAKNVTEQLKYRYRRELYNAERPALRKILEKDDIPSKTIILCIVQIYEDGVSVDRIMNTTKNIELLLTDGWYCIKASTDKMLAKLVCEKKIVVGSKIVTSGAELINCEQGVSPWEDISAVRLKLSGNSTRRARWDARLGYHGNGAILSQLSDVKLDGGKVSRLRVFITRVYPMLYVEKFEDGSTVTRSERLEHLHQMKYEADKQILLERLYEEVEKEFSDQESQDSEGVFESSNKRKFMETESQVAKIMKKSKDPAEFRASLTSSQTILLQDHTSRRREKLLHDIQLTVQEKMEKNRLLMIRNVVPLMRIRIAGVRQTRNGVEITKGMMSIWKPNDAVSELITEGAWIDVTNVVPTAIRYSEIQISAGRQSIFIQSKYKQTDKLTPYIKTLKRKCYFIKDLAENPSMTTDYNEIDAVGFIFLIDPSNQEFESVKNQLFQNVYLADTDKNIICVNFWGGIKKFGFENILDTGQVISCANLQKRAGNTKKNIAQFRVTEYSYFTKTPKIETAKKIILEFNRKLTGIDRRKLCDECISIKNNYSALKYHNNNENVSPYRFNNSDYNLSKHKMFIDTPLGIKNDKCEDFNLTDLDFESTFKQTETQELSPHILLRKRRVNERISKLKVYGEPPPLSKIHIINKSKNAANSYKSPLISKIRVCAGSVTSNKLLEESLNTTIELNNSDIQSSPVVSMNRTYVKRSKVNPVKLNFSGNIAKGANNVSDVVDHFGEDFEGSPPLSLD